MSTAEVSGGLVLPYAAITIAGKGGAAGILLITFMAVTSTLSAQVIAVSSILSFDIYRTYFNRNASDHDVIRWSHYGVVVFGVFSAAFSTMLHYVGVDLGWTLYMLGKSYGSANHALGLTFLTQLPRRPHLPRHLPHMLHNPLEAPKYRRSHRLPLTRYGHRSRRLARLSKLNVWQRNRRNHWPNPPLRLRNRRVRL